VCVLSRGSFEPTLKTEGAGFVIQRGSPVNSGNRNVLREGTRPLLDGFKNLLGKRHGGVFLLFVYVAIPGVLA